MPTSGDLKSGDFFSDQHPTSPRPSSPMRPFPGKLFFFNLDPLTLLPPPPQTSNFAGKCGSICQGPQLVEYSSNQTLSCVGVTKRNSLLFVCNEQRASRKKLKPETIIQAQKARWKSEIILEFWNIWSLNLSFLWATDPNFFLSGGFGHPYRRAGDWLCIRESWHIYYCSPEISSNYLQNRRLSIRSFGPRLSLAPAPLNG